MKRILKFDADPELNRTRFKLIYEAVKTAGLHKDAPRGIDIIRKEIKICDVLDAISDLDPSEDPARELRKLKDGVDAFVIEQPLYELLKGYLESGLVHWVPTVNGKIADVVDWFAAAKEDTATLGTQK